LITVYTIDLRYKLDFEGVQVRWDRGGTVRAGKWKWSLGNSVSS